MPFILEQEPSRDRTLEFESPPPIPAAPAAAAATPASRPPWIDAMVDAAPLVLVAALAIALLRRERWRRVVRRALLSVIVAGTVAGGMFYLTYLAGCRVMPCVDVSGIVPMLAGLGIGLVAGLVALTVVWRRAG